MDREDRVAFGRICEREDSGTRVAAAAAAVDEAGRAGLKVAAHCVTEKGARNAIEAGVASIEHGTAMSDTLLALARKLALPIRYIGVGEGTEDLLPFDAAAFAEALISS